MEINFIIWRSVGKLLIYKIGDRVGMEFITSIMQDKILLGFIIIMFVRAIWAMTVNTINYNKVSRLYKRIKESEGNELPDKLREKLEKYKGRNEYGIVNTQTLVEEYIGEGDGMGCGLNSSIKSNKGAPSQMIILGVLGTFVGLVMGLSQINFEAQESMNSLLSGIHTAFYTSIAGIIGSLLLQMIFNKWNSENVLMKYMLKLEMNLNTYIDAKRSKETFEKLIQMDENIVKISKGLYALTELETAAKELSQFNIDFGKNITFLTSTLGQSAEMMSNFSTNVMQLSSKFEGLINEFDKHNQSNKEIIKCVSGTYDSIKESISMQKEVKNMTQRMFEDENELMQSIQYRIKESFEKIDSQQEMMVSNTQKLCEYSETTLKNQQDQLGKLNKEMLGCLEDNFNAIYGKQKEGLDRIDEVFTKVSEDYQGTLHGFKENIKQLQEGFERSVVHETQQYNKVTSHFEKSENLLQQLIETYSQMDQQQGEIIRQVEKLVGELREHTESIDSSIGRNVKENLDLMKQYMKVTTDMINSKLHAMTEDRLKEEFIKAYSRMERSGKGA